MQHKVLNNWKGGLKFESEIDNHKVNMDAALESGGNDEGASPKKLLLSSVAGCTGIDVVSILNKMKVEYSEFNIEVNANLTEEHPKVYDKMHIVFEFKGNNLPLDKIEKAVELSQNKYCGVSHMFKQFLELTYEIKLIEE